MAKGAKPDKPPNPAEMIALLALTFIRVGVRTDNTGMVADGFVLLHQLNDEGKLT